MPNWCYNELSIVGDEKAVARLCEMVKRPESVIDFGKVIPYPKKYEEMDAIIDKEWPMGGKGFNSGGYEWCIDNWGTKWNACDAEVFPIEGGVGYRFDTAWSPPSPVVAALSLAFPELEFTLRFEEGGADFSGKEVYVSGECVNSLDGKYDDYPITPHPKYDENGDIIDE